MNIKPTLFATSIMLLSSPSWANEYNAELQELANGKIRMLASNSTIVGSVNAQNHANSGLAQAEIDVLDTQWREEVNNDSGPLTEKVLNNPLSVELQKVLEQEEGLFTEIFVMDNHGLNVGQSGLTSDYWQGDEAKWQKTYMLGSDAVHISEVEFDESAQSYQAQVSLSITDPASGNVIGAVTFGVNVDAI